MTTSFQFTVPDDFTSLPAGKDPDLAQLREELLAPDSGVETQLASGPAQSGSTVTIEYKADLSAAEETAQAAVVAAHVPPVQTVASMPVHLEQKAAGLPTLVDGVTVSGGPDSWLRAELPLGEPVHIGGSFVSWQSAQEGDYGYAIVCLAAGTHAPVATIGVGATAFEVPAQLAPLFDPAAGVTLVEFSDDQGNVLENRPVASLDGTTVTLAEPTTHEHSVGVGTIVPLLGAYTQLRGDDRNEGGARLLGSGELDVSNVGEITAAIPAGVTLGIRVRTSAVAGARVVATNYKLRKAAT